MKVEAAMGTAAIGTSDMQDLGHLASMTMLALAIEFSLGLLDQAS